MPLFVKNGPVVPDKLAQDLEEDRVVIFCGAGISMGAGLPSYIGLVDYCYGEFGEQKPKKNSEQWQWPDRMLGFLEGKYGAEFVREKVATRLSAAGTDLEIHESILRLATLRKSDGIRLVTTNFDHYFEAAALQRDLDLQLHSGPVVPIPRNDNSGSWKSLVYLHGRLADAGTNEHLILTSADFGRAYLTDAWAARFVAKLFADFTVLFIGYSLNDPVLRYMTDAFAAENASTASAPARGPAYIFVPDAKPSPTNDEYGYRNLTPIFYNPARNHGALKKTIRAWADARSDYLTSTRKIIDRAASSAPNALHPTSTNNLLWAVLGRKNDLGHGASVFAKHGQTPPPVSWLDAFAKFEDDTHETHSAALIKARTVGDLVPDAPASPIRTLFPLANTIGNEQLDHVAHALVGWVIRQLGNFELVEWIIGKFAQGRVLHPALRHAIRVRLGKSHGLKLGFVSFWRLASSESQWALERRNGMQFFGLRHALATGSTVDAASAKQEIVHAYSPVLELKKSYFGLLSHGDTEKPERGATLNQLAEAEVKLAGGSSIQIIEQGIADHCGGDEYWSNILVDLTELLVRTLDIYAIAGEALIDDDPSAHQRPSIVPNGQNKHREKWTKLIDRIWSGWTYLDAHSPEASLAFIRVWKTIPYLTFRRLALAAIAATSHMTPTQKLESLAHA